MRQSLGFGPHSGGPADDSDAILRRMRTSWLLPVGVIVIGLWSGIGTTQPTEEPGSDTAALFMMRLFSSTPSLAWSPDGQHLAFNQAYRYFNHGEEIEANAASLGLWVYDAGTQEVTQLVSQQRYHPSWLDDSSIVSSCSAFELCTEGLYVNQLDGSFRQVVERIGDSYNPLMTLNPAVVNNHAVYVSDAHRWYLLDLDTGSATDTGVENCSWEPPPGTQDQCVQALGEVRTWAGHDGLWVQRGEAEAVLLDAAPAFNYNEARPINCTNSHAGLLEPCLSPNGSQVAYVSGGDEGAHLRVYAVPGAEGATAISDGSGAEGSGAEAAEAAPEGSGTEPIGVAPEGSEVAPTE